jgi:EVE domain
VRSQRGAASYWIGVASRDHVLRAVEGGFAQVAHGKRAPLERMSAGYWIAYYSGRVQLGGREPCRAFTALGRVADERVYQVELGEGFRPWRRDVHYLTAHAARLEALRDSLSFLSDTRSRGLVFRRGLFRVGEQDFRAIAGAMGAKV